MGHRCEPEACNFIKKEALVQVFSCEFCEIFKNIFFMEHLPWLLLIFNLEGYYFYSRHLAVNYFRKNLSILYAWQCSEYASGNWIYLYLFDKYFKSNIFNCNCKKKEFKKEATCVCYWRFFIMKNWNFSRYRNCIFIFRQLIHISLN